MPKKLFWTPGLIAIAALMIMLLLFPTAGYAKRGTWANFSGSVKIDSHNAPLGSTITARIKGSIVGTAVVYSNSGYSWYTLDIPEQSGTGVKNGGEKGDIVSFSLEVSGQTYLDPKTDVWQEGTDVNHPIWVSKPLININTSALPDATVGLPYSVRLEAQGGTGPYTWQAKNLPVGLSISTDGVISGIPAASLKLNALTTSYNVELTATEYYGFKGEKNLVLNLIWQKGDANGDGAIDMGDVVKVTRIYSGWDSPTPGADANGDSYINMLDVTWILAYIMES
jgi:hypothetical protein